MTMLNSMMARLQTIRSYRKLHTIVSKETIRPSSPTPPHLKTHVLTLLDSFNPHLHMPFVFFYKNYNHGDINILKKSLSQCLTQYYPFAGRFLNPSEGYIDCNDEGVEFVEASHDTRLDEFLKVENYERMRELVPNVSVTSPNLLEVQLNHFAGGGVAISVSTSHKVADGTTMINFVKQWAAVTCGGSPITPIFSTSSTKYNHVILPENVHKNITQVKHAMRVFRFPNSKINELKKKIESTGSIDLTTGHPLTRVEVLSSLLVKYGVDACTTKTGSFKPSIMFHSVNMRNKFFKSDPENAVGNIFTLVYKRMDDEGEVRVDELVSKIRKGKKEVAEEKDLQETGEKFVKIFSKLGGEAGIETYWTTSLVGFPLYEIDFGRGKPEQVNFSIPDTDSRTFLLLDVPHRDWIQAVVHIPEEEMMILQQNKEFLQYVVA